MGGKTGKQPSQGNNPNQNKNTGKTSSNREETMGDQNRTGKMDESLRGSQPGTNRAPADRSGTENTRGDRSLDQSSKGTQRQGGYGNDTGYSGSSSRDKNWPTGGSE